MKQLVVTKLIVVLLLGGYLYTTLANTSTLYSYNYIEHPKQCHSLLDELVRLSKEEKRKNATWQKIKSNMANLSGVVKVANYRFSTRVDEEEIKQYLIFLASINEYHAKTI